jgi:hypothetical protein
MPSTSETRGVFMENIHPLLDEKRPRFSPRLVLLLTCGLVGYKIGQPTNAPIMTHRDRNGASIVGSKAAMSVNSRASKRAGARRVASAWAARRMNPTDALTKPRST